VNRSFIALREPPGVDHGWCAVRLWRSGETSLDQI